MVKMFLEEDEEHLRWSLLLAGKPWDDPYYWGLKWWAFNTCVLLSGADNDRSLKGITGSYTTVCKVWSWTLFITSALVWRIPQIFQNVYSA